MQEGKVEKIKKAIKRIPVECYSRVVGYYRPISQWNKGKREEFEERVPFSRTKFTDKMKVVVWVSVLLIGTAVQAQESERIAALKDYRGHYFIAGSRADQVKAMTSFRYALLYPHNIGLYAAYTQTMFWDLYEKSSPFRNIDFQPECFWEMKSNDNPWRVKIYGIKGFRIGLVEHKSNGKGGEDSRSLNRSYGLLFYDWGKRVNIGGSSKVFFYYKVSDKNADIQKYTGNFTQELFVQLRSKGQYIEKEKIYYRFGLGGNTNVKKGWHEVGARVRLVTTRIQMFLFAQLYHGYVESLLDYDEKETRFRVGVQLW